MLFFGTRLTKFAQVLRVTPRRADVAIPTMLGVVLPRERQSPVSLAPMGVHCLRTMLLTKRMDGANL